MKIGSFCVTENGMNSNHSVRTDIACILILCNICFFVIKYFLQIVLEIKEKDR